MRSMLPRLVSYASLSDETRSHDLKRRGEKWKQAHGYFLVPATLLGVLSLFVNGGCCGGASYCNPTSSSIYGAGDFPLIFGESTYTGSTGEITLTFEDVRDDARCRVAETYPRCVIADGCTGSPCATVVIKAGKAPVEEFLLYKIPACGGGGAQSFGGFSFDVYMLRPEVLSEEPIPKGDYFVRIRVERE